MNIIAVYVDNMLIACSDIYDIKFLKRENSEGIDVVEKRASKPFFEH